MIIQLQHPAFQVRRLGMGDTVLSSIDMSTVTDFLTQQVGPLPMWAWAGGVFLAAWWLTFPSGSEYRQKRRALRAQYTGVAKARRRRARVAGGLRQVVT